MVVSGLTAPEGPGQMQPSPGSRQDLPQGGKAPLVGLEAAAECIAGGGVVAVPTDTVWGLVCSPRDAAAVEAVYAAKRRPANMELTLLVNEPSAALELVGMSQGALRCAKAFWPGALSIIAPTLAQPTAASHGDQLVIPRDGSTLSVRMPAHPHLLGLLARTGPLASTSANLHGKPPPDSAVAIAELFGGAIAAVLVGSHGMQRPSTIIDVTGETPVLVREGPIPFGEILSCWNQGAAF